MPLGIHRAILFEVVLHSPHTPIVKTRRVQLLWREQCGVQHNAMRCTVPPASILKVGHDILHRTSVEDVAPFGLRCLGCRYHVTATAIKRTFLRHNTATLKPRIAITTYKVYCAMYL